MTLCKPACCQLVRLVEEMVTQITDMALSPLRLQGYVGHQTFLSLLGFLKRSETDVLQKYEFILNECLL